MVFNGFRDSNLGFSCSSEEVFADLEERNDCQDDDESRSDKGKEQASAKAYFSRFRRTGRFWALGSMRERGVRKGGGVEPRCFFVAGSIAAPTSWLVRIGNDGG